MSLRRRDPLRDPEPLIKRVYAYVSYRLGDGPEAEDVTSEVFERALRYRQSYDPSKGEPVAWLLGIARRCMQSRPPAHVELDPEQLDGLEETDEQAIDRLMLSSALTRLSTREQELVALRYGADLSAAQIARVLDIRENTVEVALHRALKRLRALLEEPGHEPARMPELVRVEEP
jgi:RNA polymerase sigma factor (sigma-70 family)